MRIPIKLQYADQDEKMETPKDDDLDRSFSSSGQVVGLVELAQVYRSTSGVGAGSTLPQEEPVPPLVTGV